MEEGDAPAERGPGAVGGDPGDCGSGTQPHGVCAGRVLGLGSRVHGPRVGGHGVARLVDKHGRWGRPEVCGPVEQGQWQAGGCGPGFQRPWRAHKRRGGGDQGAGRAAGYPIAARDPAGHKRGGEAVHPETVGAVYDFNAAAGGGPEAALHVGTHHAGGAATVRKRAHHLHAYRLHNPI